MTSRRAKASSRASGTGSTRTTTPERRIIKKTADEVFAVTGKNPLLDIALKLEDVALSDEYFISRKLYPNVDFYSGLIYQAMGFPTEMFTVLFAIPRGIGMAGPLARAHRPGLEDLPARADLDGQDERPTRLSLRGAEARFVGSAKCRVSAGVGCAAALPARPRLARTPSLVKIVPVASPRAFAAIGLLWS